jgi:hypothetical protein
MFLPIFEIYNTYYIALHYITLHYMPLHGIQITCNYTLLHVLMYDT